VRCSPFPFKGHHLERAQVFFDPAWEPSVMIGPSALSYIVNYTTRYHASTDALATILQLAHMKHFTRPLALFAGREEVEPDEELLHVLLVRTQALSAARGTSWANASSTQLLDTVDAARTNFGQRATRAREAYAMAWAVYGWFFSHGYKVLEDGGWRDAHPRLTLMRKILECTLVRDVKYWGMMIGYGSFAPSPPVIVS
jgi:origin recognition complex subunit 3